MNILILGPQGSGKGTQARLICEKYGFYYFEAGGFLREMAAKNDVLEKDLSSGKLVPDEELSSYVMAFLDDKSLYDNILFDGFPRTQAQYQTFYPWLKDKNMQLDLVLVLNINEKETIRRLSGRRMDPVDGKIYNLVTETLPKSVNPDRLVQREDDKPPAIKKRLAWYKSSVIPLIDELKKTARVEELDGKRPVKDIFADIEKIIGETNGKNNN